MSEGDSEEKDGGSDSWNELEAVDDGVRVAGSVKSAENLFLPQVAIISSE